MAIFRDATRGRFRPPYRHYAAHAIAGGLMLLATCSFAVAQTASLLPNAKQTFLDANGNPLVGGSVTTYVPNTTVPKQTFVDPNSVTANANPITLDSAGRAIIFGQGNYRQIVKDSSGNTQWDSFTSAPNTPAAGSVALDTAPVGTVVPFAGFVVPTNWLLADGQVVSRSTYATLLSTITISTTVGICQIGSHQVGGFADTSQMAVGEPVEASCLPSNTTISSITNSSTIQVNNTATANATETVTVFPWGNGDGSTTFALPDLRGRAVAGADAMGGVAASRLTSTYYGVSAAAPNAAGGSQSATVAQANLPSVNFNVSGIALTDPGHSHIAPDLGHQTPNGSGSNIAVTAYAGPPATYTQDVSTQTSTTGITIKNVGGVQGAAASGGSGTPLPTIQPTLTANYIIKVLAPSVPGGGVVSLGGLTGDIICDSPILCETIGGVNQITISGAVTGVFGPNSTTVGDLAVWNNGSGSLLADVPIGSILSNTTPTTSVTPTGNNAATLTSFNVQTGTLGTSSGSNRRFLVNLGMTVNSTGNNGNVVLYSGIDCQAAADDCWIQNPLMELDSGYTQTAQMSEWDLNNFAYTANSINTSTLALSTPYVMGINVSGDAIGIPGIKRSTAAFAINGASWQYGFVVPFGNDISQAVFAENTSAAWGIQLLGTHASGAIQSTGFTVGPSGTTIVNPTGTTASAIYSSISPAVTFADTNQTVTSLTSSNTDNNYGGVSSYVTSAGGGNSVALFGVSRATANNTAVWGANTLIQDNSTRATGALTGITTTGYEADFNIMNTGTNVIGVSVGGNSLAQPTSATGINVASLGNGNKWTGGIVTQDGAASIGIVVGALATTASQSSQPVILHYRDSGGNQQSVTVQASAIGVTSVSGGLSVGGQLTSTTGTPTISSGACGTGSNGAVVAGSTNQSGQITIGASATTSCTISWSTTLAVAPNACVFFPMNATAAATGTTVARVGAPSTTQVVLSGSALASANYAYMCL